ncbi:MAG: PEGA domain-containing protein [Spirochaetota bacterium]|nr:PEGA domain-containing protein [Spirochaetota bacterium]
MKLLYLFPKLKKIAIPWTIQAFFEDLNRLHLCNLSKFRCAKNRMLPHYLFTVFFICFFNLCLWSSSKAELIIRKEPYSIPEKKEYKKTITIAVLPFEGSMESERMYLKDILKNFLEDRILSYKWIIISQPVKNFERRGVKSNFIGKDGNDTGIKSQSIIMEKDKPASVISPFGTKRSTNFLSLALADNDIINNIAYERDCDSLDSVGSGIDVIIDGGISQKGRDIRIDVKVYNDIYGKVFTIGEEGSLKNINQLFGRVFSEVMKAIMVNYGYLDISVNPQDAKIYVDGRYFRQGTNIILESGDHRVEISKDGRSEVRDISLLKDESKSFFLSIHLKDVGKENRLDIITNPKGARVYLDSDFIGFSPVVMNQIRKGKYRIRVDMEGHISKYKTLMMGEGEDKRIEFYLEKGESAEFYFSRSKVYSNVFHYSLLTATASLFTAFYFELRVVDEEAKQRGSNFIDAASPTIEEIYQYEGMMKRTGDRIDKYELYRNIFFYSAITLFINSLVFYYLDIAQDDIPIAKIYPQYRYSEDISVWNYNNTGVALTFTFRY